MSSSGKSPGETDLFPRPRWQDPDTLRTLATALLVVALSYWLLDKLTVVLRPLLLAVLMTYVLLPYHNRLRKVVPAVVSVVLLAGFVAVLLLWRGRVRGLREVSGELQSDLPKLQKQATDLVNGVHHWIKEHTPWADRILSGGKTTADGETSESVQKATRAVVSAAPGVVAEALTAGLYLLFLLLGAGQLGNRVRGAYDTVRADQILDVFGQINSAIISYLKAKVLASLGLAFFAGIILTACGVRFALLWAVLTFLCNFIPYAGTIVAYCVPIGFAAVAGERDWTLVLAASLLLATHILSATIFEPMILGKAVGLSPLVILAALALWGSLWGFPGMLMAVPLSVVVLIVLEHFEASRPVAKLLEGS